MASTSSTAFGLASIPHSARVRATRISASSYGRPPLPQPYLRPANAFDGDPETAWEVYPDYVDPVREHVRVDLRHGRRLSAIEVTTTAAAPTAAAPDPMRIARLDVVLSDGTITELAVKDGRARAMLPDRRTTSIEIRIAAVTGTDLTPFGLADVAIDDLHLQEVVQLPVDLARRAARRPALAALLDAAPLTFQFARLDPVDDRDVETTLRRRFDVFGTRDFALRATGPFDPSTASDQCRDVGITVAGRPLLVRIRAESPAVDATATGCDRVVLGPGPHTLRVASGSVVRRLWLTEKAEAGSGSRKVERADSVRRGRSDFEVAVNAQAPAYVISGASFDPGWSATIDGGDAGAQVSMDGQAAWRVPAGTHTLVGERSDQGGYVAALLVSALGVLTCLVLVVRGRVR